METLTSKAEADGLAQEKWADLFIGKNGSFWLWIQPIPARRDRRKPAKCGRFIELLPPKQSMDMFLPCLSRQALRACSR